MKELRIKGEKINLRRVHKADALSIAGHAKDKEVAQYTLIPHPYKLEHACQFIRYTHIWYRKKRNYVFGIENKETGNIIGMIGLHRISWKNKNGELGYWLGKKYWGQGITTEAVGLMLKFAFEELKLRRVYARVMHPNIASTKVLKKHGFKHEGRLRQAEFHHERWLDFLYFGILKAEYLKRHKIKRPQIHKKIKGSRSF